MRDFRKTFRWLFFKSGGRIDDNFDGGCDGNIIGRFNDKIDNKIDDLIHINTDDRTMDWWSDY